VRRTDFFPVGSLKAGETSGRAAVALANFDGFLFRRLTLSYSARAGRFGLSGPLDSGHPLQLVRSR
jgi:hypothetical protein